MKLSERLYRTHLRQRSLGRYEVSDWYVEQWREVMRSGDDPEHPPLRNVIERYQEKRGFVRAPIPSDRTAVHLTK